jgi:hypothetical protein
MQCKRCGGLSVVEGFTDLKGSGVWFEGSRCLNCGSIEDAVIRKNGKSGTGSSGQPAYQAAGRPGMPEGADPSDKRAYDARGIGTRKVMV